MWATTVRVILHQYVRRSEEGVKTPFDGHVPHLGARDSPGYRGGKRLSKQWTT